MKSMNFSSSNLSLLNKKLKSIIKCAYYQHIISEMSKVNIYTTKYDNCTVLMAEQKAEKIKNNS